ncbi:MAG: Signal peptidase [Cyanobacteriota bacterium]|jgi:signal peptidase I
MQESPASSRWQFLRENGPLLIIALVLALLIRIFIAEPRYIPSDSMLPTLERGDRLVVEKVSYHFHPPQVGDIVVFHPPELLQRQGYQLDQAFIKRVIATPGQTVQVENGVVYRNGVPLAETYTLEAPYYHLPLIEIPDNQLFVMGDNRNNSNDSHIWGFLPEKNIIGHALFRFYPVTRWGKI